MSEAARISLATAPELLRFAIGSVDRAEVLRYLGYRGQEITPELDARIDAVVKHCIDTCEPAGIVRIFDLAQSVILSEATAEGEGGVEGPRAARMRAEPSQPVCLAGSALSLPGASIAEHLAGARAAALLTVTLGLKSEQELHRLSLTDPLEQVIFDAAGTALVERAADAAEAHVVAHAAGLGLYTNDRFAPGYGDLPLSVQPGILEALNARRLLGITLTPSNMLVPSKSETAVIGIFDYVPARREGGLCGCCTMFDFCTVRSTGRTCRSA